MKETKELVWQYQIITDDLDFIFFKLHGLDIMIERHPEYFYEDEILIGPPYELNLNLYKTI